jgi:hypothetical protein
MPFTPRCRGFNLTSMLERRQIEAIVRYATENPRYTQDKLWSAARDAGLSSECFCVHVSNYRAGRVPASWYKVLNEGKPG